jgi:hypothetical protein
VQAGVLERDRRLVGEERQRAPVPLGERADPAAALLVRHHQESSRLAVRLDRHGQQVLRPGKQPLAVLGRTGEERRQPRIVVRQGGLRLAAQGAIEAETADLAQVESPAAGVEQRDGAHQHGVGDLVELEGRGDRQPDVVERLELDAAVVHCEALLMQAAAQAAGFEAGAESHQQRSAGRQHGSLGRDHQQTAAADHEPGVRVRGEGLRKLAPPGAGATLEGALAKRVERGAVERRHLTEQRHEALEELLLGVLALRQLEQLSPVGVGCSGRRRGHVTKPARRAPNPRRGRSWRTA